jgi:hypothetical protein
MTTGRRRGLPAPPADVKPGELHVHVYEPDRDDWGRVRFFLYWCGHPSDDIRCLGSTQRGQAFHADERLRVREALERGDRVFMWPSGVPVI